MDELSQLDELMELDILDALGQTNVDSDKTVDLDEIQIEDFNEIEPSLDLDDSDKSTLDTKITAEANTSDLVSILSQLLNNKTIEITIKIKD